MKVGQDFVSSQVCNYDETALTWGIQPQYLYGPKDADTAEQEYSDEKARITLIPTGQANGKFLPLFFILKHSVSSTKIQIKHK